MSARRFKLRPSPAESQAAAVSWLVTEWPSLTTVQAAGRDPEMRRMATAEQVYLAWTTPRDRRSRAQVQLLRVVRIWTEGMRHNNADFLALGERVADVRREVEATMTPHSPEPEPARRVERRRLDAAARRLMRRAHGLPAGPSPEREMLAEAGRDASRRAQQADATDGLSLDGLRVVLSVVRAVLREVPDLSAAEAEALRWATPAGGDVRGPLDDLFQDALGLEGLALSRAIARGSLLPDVLDLVRRRQVNPDSTTQNPKG